VLIEPITAAMVFSARCAAGWIELDTKTHGIEPLLLDVTASAGKFL
jgi:hypothetical protein